MLLETGNIVKFLQTAYSDENLAALQAHIQDGHFTFMSCCCFIGIPTADHALRGDMPLYEIKQQVHYLKAKDNDLGFLAEAEVFQAMWALIDSGAIEGNHKEDRIGLASRFLMRPLVAAEFLRREKDRAQSSTNCLDAAEAVEVA